MQVPTNYVAVLPEGIYTLINTTANTFGSARLRIRDPDDPSSTLVNLIANTIGNFEQNFQLGGTAEIKVTLNGDSVCYIVRK